MKVLMVTPYYYPVIGGVESLVENVAIKLNERGIQTDIMTFNYSSNFKPIWRRSEVTLNNVKIIRMPVIRLPRPTFFINHLTKNLREELKHYDIIHFHNETDLSFPIFSYHLNRPKLLHTHVLDTTYNYFLMNPVIKRVFVNLADIYIALSNFAFKLLTNLGVPPQKIKILPNGIDVSKFRESGKEKSENLLLFVGRLDPKKGLDTLLASLKYIEKPVELVIIGPSSNYIGYSQYIIKLINDVSKSSRHNIRYIGKVNSEDLIRWYQKASMLIMPSIHESFPMVNLESLACGTPVIASNVGAIPEVVHNYENGLLIPPSNPIKLAAAIQYLIDNEQERLKFGKFGRKWIVENYSTDITVKKYISLYQLLQ